MNFILYKLLDLLTTCFDLNRISQVFPLQIKAAIRAGTELLLYSRHIATVPASICRGKAWRWSVKIETCSQEVKKLVQDEIHQNLTNIMEPILCNKSLILWKNFIVRDYLNTTSRPYHRSCGTDWSWHTDTYLEWIGLSVRCLPYQSRWTHWAFVMYEKTCIISGSTGIRIIMILFYN